MPRSTSPRKPYMHSHARTPTSSYPTTPIRNPTFDYLTSTLQSPEEHVSPTKALALSRLQHDVSQIQSWLEALFAPGVVPVRFLKWRDEAIASASDGLDGNLISSEATRGVNRQTNSDGSVLDALKALKQANLAANHLASLVHDAEEEELEWLMSHQERAKTQLEAGSQARILADELLSALPVDGYEALGHLSHSAVEVGLTIPSEDDTNGLQSLFVLRLLDRAQRQFIAQQQDRELEFFKRKIELRSTPSQNVETKGYQSTGDHIQQGSHDEAQTKAVQLNRDTKQINLKVMEYEDRARGLEKQLDRIRPETASMREMIMARNQMEERKNRVRELQARFTVFNGLPPDLEASRVEVRRAKDELDALKRQRDALFEKLGSN